jgi:phosphoglycolate phosphatase-like HAD superfamily hydrolase
LSAPLVIFDVDGVLVDTVAANVEAYQFACRRMGLPMPEVDLIRPLLGRSAEEMAIALGCPPATDYPKPDPRGLEEIVARFPRAAPRYLVDDRGKTLAGADYIGARRIFAAYGLGAPAALTSGRHPARTGRPADVDPAAEVLGSVSDYR